MDSCWNRYPHQSMAATSRTWSVGNRIFLNGEPASTGAKRGSDFGKFMFYEASSIPQSAWLQTPYIDIAPLNNTVLKFHYHFFGKDIAKLIIQQRSIIDSNWVSIDSIVGPHQHFKLQYFKLHTIPISSNSDTLQFRFKAYNNSGNLNHLAIDQVKVEDRDCGFINYPVVISTSDTSAIISYTASTNITGVEVRYGITGFNLLDSINTVFSSNANNINITGLLADHQYEVYSRPICGTMTGEWLPPLHLSTTCADSIKDFPFMEDFNSWPGDTTRFPQVTSQTTSNCWRTNHSSNINNGAYWRSSAGRVFSNFEYPVSDKSGIGFFLTTALNGQLTQPDSISVSTPYVSLKNSVNPQLSFWIHIIEQSPSAVELIVIAQSNNKTIILDTINGPTQVAYTDPWINKVYNLPQFKSDTLRIIFLSHYDGREISLDEVWLREKPGCALAGNDSIVELCNSERNLALGILLDSLAYSGSWLDLQSTGALSAGNIVDLTLLQSDSAYLFRYVIPADSSCLADSATFTIIRSSAFCLGFTEAKLNSFNIFPNPAQGRLNIAYSGAEEIKQLSIFSLDGKQVYSAQKQVNEVVIADWQPGLYLLQIVTEKGVYNARFAKE